MHETFLCRTFERHAKHPRSDVRRAPRARRDRDTRARRARGAGRGARPVRREGPSRRAAGLARRSFTMPPFWRAPSGAQAVLRPLLLPMAGFSALLLLLACINVAQAQLARAQTRERTGGRAARGGRHACAARARDARRRGRAPVADSRRSVPVIVAWWSAHLLVRIVPAADFTPRFNVAIDPWRRRLADPRGGCRDARRCRSGALGVAHGHRPGAAAGGRHAHGLPPLGPPDRALVVAAGLSRGRHPDRCGATPPQPSAYQTGDLGFDARECWSAATTCSARSYSARSRSRVPSSAARTIARDARVASATIARWIPLGLTGAGRPRSRCRITCRRLEKTARPPEYRRARRTSRRCGFPCCEAAISTRAIRNGRRVAAVSQSAAERFWPGRDPFGATGRVRRRPLRGRRRRGQRAARRTRDRRARAVRLYPAGAGISRRHDPARPRPRASRCRSASSARSLRRSIPICRRPSRGCCRSTSATRVPSTRGSDSLRPLRRARGAARRAWHLRAALAHFVVERTRELAVRMALGAEPPDLRVWCSADRSSSRPPVSLPGLALGLWASRFLSALLIGVRPADPGHAGRGPSCRPAHGGRRRARTARAAAKGGSRRFTARLRRNTIHP